MYLQQFALVNAESKGSAAMNMPRDCFLCYGRKVEVCDELRKSGA